MDARRSGDAAIMAIDISSSVSTAIVSTVSMGVGFSEEATELPGESCGANRDVAQPISTATAAADSTRTWTRGRLGIMVYCVDRSGQRVNGDNPHRSCNIMARFTCDAKSVSRAANGLRIKGSGCVPGKRMLALRRQVEARTTFPWNMQMGAVGALEPIVTAREPPSLSSPCFLPHSD